MPDCQNHPARVGRMQGLASICGRDTDGSAKRPTLTGHYSEPQLPWADRKRWLWKVNELAAECSARHESYPHKVTAVARALAFAGDVCKPSIEYLASKAGCVENTVKACLAWLEERGALTWSNTARRHTSGRMVRLTPKVHSGIRSVTPVDSRTAGGSFGGALIHGPGSVSRKRENR